MWPLIDILELHHQSNTEKSWVRAFGGVELNQFFKDLCNEVSQRLNTSYKEIAKKIFNVNPNSLQSWKRLNKNEKDGKILTTFLRETKKLYSLNLFRGQKRRKLKNLLNR